MKRLRWTVKWFASQYVPKDATMATAKVPESANANLASKGKHATNDARQIVLAKCVATSASAETLSGKLDFRLNS